jgi:UDP-N-acetylglucosamine 2-epimerase (non-hydrolysing)
MNIVNVVGARPNFIKISPLVEAMRCRSEQERSHGRAGIDQILVHTGQHYDREMSTLFFDQLGIPAPDVNLEVGSGTHAAQTAAIMTRFESVCIEHKPSHILVVGDVNSTIACALVAVKLNIRIIHVEAGLRSFDRRMPEEINRILTDAISDLCFTTEESANENLRREGIPQEKIYFVGNVMIDTLLKHRKEAEQSPILEKLGLATKIAGAKPYCVLTLHRPGNVDDPVTFKGILGALSCIAVDIPIVFPVHPRTKSKIDSYGLRNLVCWALEENPFAKVASKGIHAIEPLGYLEFLRLMSCARLVLTDSGGIQEETTILGVPCVTLRDTTERPATVSQGTNVLAGTKSEEILAKTYACLKNAQMKEPPGDRQRVTKQPALWDGKAAQRIVDVLINMK